MSPPNENAPAGTKALNTTSYKGKYKRFPPYGKKLMPMRLAGKVPTNVIMVVFDWKYGRAYPRIVIDGDTPIESLEFSYLSASQLRLFTVAKTQTVSTLWLKPY